MTKFLLRLFFRQLPDPADPASRGKIGIFSGIVGIFCNLLLFTGKLIVGLASHSVSITADAMNNLSDATSSIVTLLGFRLAERPADEDHPYGHARYEYLSGLAVAALIVVIGFELARTSFEKILHPTPVEFSLPLVLVLAGSIGVKLWMYFFNRGLGKFIGSQTLMATAADSRNDAISTAAVLLAGCIEAVTDFQADGIMGLLVALFILYGGIDLAKETISPLLGEAASPELQKKIEDLVCSNPKVLGFHDLMVHDYGPGQRFASIHVEMDKREDPMTCHEIIDDLERACLRNLRVHLVIHYDPITVGDPVVDETRRAVLDILHGFDQRLDLHDFRMISGSGHTNLVFDVALPMDLRGKEKEITKTVEEKMHTSHDGTYYAIITFDPSAFRAEKGQ